MPPARRTASCQCVGHSSGRASRAGKTPKEVGEEAKLGGKIAVQHLQEYFLKANPPAAPSASLQCFFGEALSLVAARAACEVVAGQLAAADCEPQAVKDGCVV